MPFEPFAQDNWSPTSIEWPTWLLLISAYSAWLAITYFWSTMPTWLIWLPAGYIVALYSSLQHEAIHKHPTRNDRFNQALVWAPLLLWLPVACYRDNHRQHHQSILTNPQDDPESYFVSPQRWHSMNRLLRSILLANNSFIGRMLIGSPLAIGQFWWIELKQLRSGDYRHAQTWIAHLAGVAVILYWVVVVCSIPFHLYLLCVVWPGTSMMMIRSFLEHRFDKNQEHRTVMVEGGPLTRLLFLNNNYHWIHHHYPDLAWYRIPAMARQQQAQALHSNGHYYYPGYWTIARRYLLKPWTHPMFPGEASVAEANRS